MYIYHKSFKTRTLALFIIFIFLVNYILYAECKSKSKKSKGKGKRKTTTEKIITTTVEESVYDDYGSDDEINLDNFDIERDAVSILPSGKIKPTQLQLTSEGDTLTKITTKKIIGGRNTKITDAPYQIAILFDGSQVCGGSLFNKQVILTAAHCFYEGTGLKSRDDLQKYEIVAGDYDLVGTEGYEQKRKVTKIIIHPGYRQGQSLNDLAILKINNPLTYTKQVQPLPIGDPSANPQGTLVISGWGYTKARKQGSEFEDAYFPNILKSTEILFVPKETCKKKYSHSRVAYKLASSDLVFCGGIEKGGQDACSGDSGGPVACFRRDGENPKQKFLCGLVATGFGCGLPGMPGFYTKVGDPNIHRWIVENGGFSDKPTLMY